MCGIVAKVGLNGEIDTAKFDSAVASLLHRGPDGSGVWLSEDRSVALGHTRLAIRGIGSGSQPMVFEQQQLALVVNGELYDYPYLKTMLSHKGHRFTTNSDSELVAHLYLEYGLAFTRYLRGEFSFVLFDGKSQRLVAVRDRFGIKPLVYSAANGEIALASECKALFALGHSAKWDTQSVLHSFTHQYLPPERTLFDGIKQLPPAHMLIFQNGTLDVQSYWQAPLSSNEDFPAADELAQLLENAVEQRLEAEVTPAFSLSGGIDSSLVVAMAAQTMKVKPTCFNIAFFDKQYDESAKAGAFAQSIGARFHQVRVSADDLVLRCGDAACFSEGLGINGQYVGKFMLSQAVNQAGFKIMLSGEGADEAFFGYGHLQHDYYAHHHLPGSEQMLAALAQAFPLQSGIMMSGDATSSESSRDLPGFVSTKMAMTQHLLPLLRKPFEQGDFRHSCIDRLMAPFAENERFAKASAVERSAQLWTQLAMSGYILNTLGDGMEMAHSVEGRLPFLDHHLFEAAQRLPLGHKFQGTEAKHALRLLAKRYLPAELAERPKHPFLAPPMIGALSKNARDAVYGIFDRQVLKSNPFVDEDKVHRYLDDIFVAPRAKQAAADPCLMMMLTLLSVQNAFSITDHN